MELFQISQWKWNLTMEMIEHNKKRIVLELAEKSFMSVCNLDEN